MSGTDCPICCESYNKSSRKAITCECSDCDFTSCKECVRTYLLSQTSDPSCMHCNKAWSQRFLSSSLNQSFINGDFRKHRAKVLREVQQSRLQDSVQAAQRQIESETLDKEIGELNQLIIELSKKLEAAKNKRDSVRARKYALRRGLDVEENTEEKRQFIVPCSAPDCRGFLSTQWKCGLCNLYACKECLEIIGYNKDEPHECKPENVASAQMIRKDTRPCPACGVRIHKLEGCDQMWCTECHVAFSWRTGKRSNSSIHNPHYLEWQRKNEVNGAVKAINDVACGGLITHYMFTYHILEPSICAFRDSNIGGSWSITPAEIDNIYQILGFNPVLLVEAARQMFRVANTVQNISLPALRQDVQNLENFESIRVKYLLNRVTMEQFEAAISSKDLKRRKTLQVLHVMELLGTVLTETFRDINIRCEELGRSSPPCYDSEIVAYINKNNVLDKYKEALGFQSHHYPERSLYMTLYLCRSLERMESVINYCNTQFGEISVAFNLSVPYIHSNGELWRNPDEDTKVRVNNIRSCDYGYALSKYRMYELSSNKFTKKLCKKLSSSTESHIVEGGGIPTENIKISK